MKNFEDSYGVLSLNALKDLMHEDEMIDESSFMNIERDKDMLDEFFDKYFSKLSRKIARKQQ